MRAQVLVIVALLACEHESTPTRHPPGPVVIRAELETGPANTVTGDRGHVTLRSPSGRVETIGWSDVRRITVVTTDKGPRLTDVFIVLDGATDRLIVPQDAVGNEGFVDLLTHIDGF